LSHVLLAQDVEASVIPRQHVHSAYPMLSKQGKDKIPRKPLQVAATRPESRPVMATGDTSRPFRVPSEKAERGTVVEFSRLADTPSERVQLVPRRQVGRNNIWIPEIAVTSVSRPSVERESTSDDLGEDGQIHVDPIVINPLEGRAAIL